MQAYSMAETVQSPQLHPVQRPSALAGRTVGDRNSVLDQLLVELADVVAERVAARLVARRQASRDEWLDTRRAAEYLGIGRDSLRRLAAERAIPTEQAGGGCKLYFRRSDLDEWRCSGSMPVVAMRDRHHG
jgi:excisionase family DNA binding protein